MKKKEALKLSLNDISMGDAPYSENEALNWIHKSKTEGQQTFLWWSRKKNKGLFWSEVKIQYTQFETEEYVVVLVRDVTHRIEFEENLRKRDSDIQAIFDATAYGIFIIDVEDDGDFSISNMNKADEEITGVKAEEVRGKKFRDFFPLDVANQITANYRKCIEQNQTISYEEEVNLPALGIKFALTTLVPVKDKSGKIIRIVGSTLDITSRKKIETNLYDEKERLAVTLKSIGDGVISTDTKGRVLIINKSAEVMTGWSQSEAEGKQITDIFHIINQKTKKNCVNPVEKVIKTGQIVELANDTMLISKNGTEMIITDSAAPIKNSDNETVGVVLVFRDVTEKHNIQETVQRTSKLESLAVLAGGIAHDFNNLLGGIYGSLELSNLKSKENKRHEYIENAINTINRARSLTQQLLTFSKGGNPVKKVSHLFPFIENTTRFALSGSNVTAQFLIEDNLWLVNYDENQIGQVIENIVINAQQAMPVGGSIEISAKNEVISNTHPMLKSGQYVKISVKDSGIGIPGELISKIFDPFFTTKSKGHGLGLATSYSIIYKHNGTIEVESLLGLGTTFHIFLPASLDTVLSDETQEAQTEFSDTGLILVMDDEEIIQNTVKEMLTYFGYEVVCLDNGSKAVDYVLNNTENKLKAMIFDLTIPGGMGGKEATEIIRKNNIQVPIIVASGYSDDPIMANPQKYGFTASISKPFSHKELQNILIQFVKTKNS
ncbi:MAG: PAS domain S-box protein [Candidatus Cloacimonetes bacterium]|nr:PAS domain S-box protein [Candidatus Cloacimonadota bacterium]